jgi:hypothetical protein
MAWKILILSPAAVVPVAAHGFLPDTGMVR